MGFSPLSRDLTLHFYPGCLLNRVRRQKYPFALLEEHGCELEASRRLY